MSFLSHPAVSVLTDITLGAIFTTVGEAIFIRDMNGDGDPAKDYEHSNVISKYVTLCLAFHLYRLLI